MDPERLFSLANGMVLPGWVLLVFAPRWRWSARLVGPVLVPALLGALYAVLIAGWWAGAEGGFGSLADVQRLFANPYLLLAGWVHYLAFDLFLGSWEVRDSRRHSVPHLLVVPCLLLTFLFGPIGLLLYLAVRWVGARRWIVDEGPEA